jgi:TRAP-type transport system periplasmic protein
MARAMRLTVAAAIVSITVAAAGCSSSGSSTSANSGAGTNGGSSPSSSTTASAASGPSVSLKLGDVLSSTDSGTAALNYFAGQVSSLTGGNVKITIYPNAQLVSEQDIVSALRSGAVDMGLASDDFWSTITPGIDALSYPYKVTSWTQAKAIATNSALNSYLSSEYQKMGVHYIADLPYTWKELLSTSPVSQPGQLKGFKVSTAGGDLPYLSALGMTPDVMNNTDLYEGLLTHTVSASNISVSQIVSLKLYEVAKYLTEYNLYMIWLPVIMSDNAWNKLSAAEQTALTTAGQAMVSEQISGAQAAQKAWDATLTSNGVHITSVSDFGPWEATQSSVVSGQVAQSPVATKILSLAAAAS